MKMKMKNLFKNSACHAELVSVSHENEEIADQARNDATFYKMLLCSFLLILFSGKSMYAQLDEQLNVGITNADERPEIERADEAIAHLGYNYAIPEWMATNSKSTITATLLGQSVNTNFGNTLYGRLPGLTVVNNGNEAGSDSPTLYSRGIGTFGEGRDVLVLVDGFECFYYQLIPEEVESVTLLKDAASTAKYGMRGANGVLLITTKRGKEGVLKINFSAQTGFESPYRLPDFLSSYYYARLYNEALENDGLPRLYSADDLAAWQSGSDPYFYPDVNWHDELLRKHTPTSKYHLSFSGGKNRVRYFVLIGGMQRTGIYKKTEDLSEFSINSKFAQYNVRTNVDIDITDRLTASVNMGFTLANNQNPRGVYDMDSERFQDNVIFNRMSLIAPNTFPVYNPNGSYGGTSVYTNLWGDILETGMFTFNNRTSQSSLKLTNQLDMIADGLSVSAAASFNNSFRGFSFKSRTYDRYYISKDASGEVTYFKFGEPTPLEVSERNSEMWRNFAFYASLNYTREMGEHYIDAALGYDLTSNTVQNQDTDFRHLGFNGRVTYAWQRKYIGELSVGYYGSNGYMKGERFGFFPAGSAGWIVSNEDFLNGNDIISFLKLKASYGISGNNTMPNNHRFLYHQYYGGTGSYLFGSSPITGYAESRIANPYLSWEKKKELNIGLDATLLDFLDVRFDYFWENRYDILTIPQKEFPQFAGMTLSQMNVGEVSNKGFEAMLGYQSRRVGDLNFFASLNVWYARNTITNAHEIVNEYPWLQKEGKRIDQPFLLESLGFFESAADISQHALQAWDAVQPGDLKYKDQNHDDLLNEQDLYPIGYTKIPELTLGLTAGFNFRNFYMNIFFQAVANRSIYLEGLDFHAFQNDGKISSIANGRWTEATRSSADYPRLSSTNNMNNYRESSFWQRNGSFVKLRNVELGYTLPKSLTGKAGIAETTIFVNGANVFTLDHVKIADPEILTGYPATRMFTVGVRIEL